MTIDRACATIQAQKQIDVISHMTRDEVVAEVRRAVERAGSQKAWAKVAGVTVQHVNDVLSGHRGPGPKVLDALGLEKVVTYQRKDGGSDA